MRSEVSAFAPVERPRLVDQLASAARFPIALLIAPAGYGKSVVLRQYLAKISGPCVRFSLHAEHATLLSFLRGFAEALGENAPHAMGALAGAYERSQGSAKRGSDLARWMHAHLESFGGMIAVDDLHVAEGDPEVTDFLASLIERSKGTIRWIIASRSTAGIPVASWFAYNDADSPIDEQALRFTFDEARAAAAELQLKIGDAEVRDLLEFTEGWPAAMSFALRTSTRSSELRNVSAVTREMIYRFLAEQVYAALRDDERALLEVATALPSIDVEVLERAGFDRALHIVERLRERTAFIYEEKPGIYQCHDLFREFLRHQSALGGARTTQVLHERVARALEASGDVEHAIAAYATAACRADVLRLLERHGFELLERARSDVVSRAIEALDERTRRGNATTLGLLGALHAITGRFSRAESHFRRALAGAGADRELVAIVSLRLAAIMANEGSDVTALLGTVGNDLGQSPAFRAEAISLIAGQQAVKGNTDKAADYAATVERLLGEFDSDVVSAKALQRIGIAYHHLGMGARAFEVLTKSREIADEAHLFSLASRANAVLSNLALHELDDVELQLRYAEQAVIAARKAGDAYALQTALLQMLSGEMRRGNGDRSIAIEQQLATIETSGFVRIYLKIFRSLRLGWEGRFSEAHALLSTCWQDMTFSFDRSLCGAQLALFLAVDGKHAEAGEIVKHVVASIREEKIASQFRFRAAATAKGLCALANAVIGRLAYAERAAKEVAGSSDEVVRTMAAAIASIVSRMRSGSASGTERTSELIHHLEHLGYVDLGRVLRAVDLKIYNEILKRPRAAGLTRSEIEVLALLDEGLAAKEIAKRTARSLYTVRAHIANAIAKLGCHGHSEAIRLARKLRLI